MNNENGNTGLIYCQQEGKQQRLRWTRHVSSDSRASYRA
jgi:hypothetical protein